MAFKTVDSEGIKEAVVDHIYWRETSYGRLTPTVILVGDGVNIAGVNIKRVSAHNAKFVVDNKIGPGSVVQMVRGGDVIPHIHEVVSGASLGEAQMPEVEFKWKGVDVFTVTAGEGRQVDLLMKFFRGINVKGIGPSKVKLLYENGVRSLVDYMEMDPEEINEIKGMSSKTAIAMKNEIKKCLDECELVNLMVASGSFGEGLALRKITPIIEAFPPSYKTLPSGDQESIPIEFPIVDPDIIADKVSGISTASAIQ